ARAARAGRTRARGGRAAQPGRAIPRQRAAPAGTHPRRTGDVAVTEQHQSPAPFDPALYLIEKAHQPVPPTFRPAPQLPPRRTASRWLWEHFGRIAPGLATSSLPALAWSRG